jgi:hypothetical protein
MLLTVSLSDGAVKLTRMGGWAFLGSSGRAAYRKALHRLDTSTMHVSAA